MSGNVGIQTNVWSHDRHINNLSSVLAEVAAAGYEGIEIGAHRLDLGDPIAFRQMLAQHRLVTIGIHVHGDLHRVEWLATAAEPIRKAIDFAAAVGAPFMAISGRVEANKSEEALRVQAENLNKLGRLSRDESVRLCYHNHYWEIENHFRELHSLCEQTDPALVELVLDVGWVKRSGGHVLEAVQTFEERIAYLHIKDTTAGGQWTEIGAGTVDFAGLFANLAEKGHDWWLVVERDEALADALGSARQCRHYLQSAFRI